MLRLEGMKLEWLALEYGVSVPTIFRIVNKVNKIDAILALPNKGLTDGTY